jgi:putative inorganic carbon (HCO3(-)) transporter
MKNKLFLPLVLAVASIAIPFLMVKTTYLLGVLIIFGLFGIACLLLILHDYKYGVYILLLYGASFVYVGRILQINFPYGVPFDILLLLTFFIIAIKHKHSFEWKLNEPITILQFIFYAYFIIQIANPNSVNISAWINASRFLTLFFLYYIFIHFFNSKNRVKNFTKMWLIIAVIAALYGLKQEFLGLDQYEWAFVRESEIRYRLFFIWGHMRVFSIFFDPSAYGLFLGFCGTATLLMAFGKISIQKRIMYFFLASLMFYAMSFAGTRTAFALVFAGVALFIIANVSNPKVLAGSFFLVLIFAILMVGPFYSGPINRMRSTFKLSEDASMAVRDMKRIRLQAYVKSHPIGGGLNTAGNSGLSNSKGHPLAGKYDPDSGYLRTALEMGWIGLLLSLLLYGSVVIGGIRNYFRLYDPDLKLYAIIYTCAFFGLSVAHYAQDALFQKPINILVVASFALMVKLKDLDTELQTRSKGL